ncbi:putative lrr receptor-like serine/threonine-protein kinase [Quercus suber]|uniref:Lrr receptor-like serine/threonine-protein kinase n=1 Tax=Quercus suber TaxID=58331 RepID=A0AAW0ITX4_QUESU
MKLHQTNLYALWPMHLHIQIFDLSQNYFLGLVPTNLGNLPDLRTLDLSNVNPCQVEANVYKCLVSVLEIGLACSVESPKERMNMEEVSKELHSIKNAFLASPKTFICIWPIYLIFVMNLCLLQPTMTANAPTNEIDCLALLKFKESISHDPYMMLSSWNDSMHFCNWFGITCGRRHQRVMALILSLSDNKLVGNIPNGIGNLKGLYFFSISVNNLSGTIPSSLYNISSLQTISFSENQLEGTLPDNIGLTLPNLNSLLFGENYFLGSIPTNLGNLPYFYWLALSDNDLGGSLDFLTSLTNCSKLETVDLSTNQFGGVLPISIYNLSTQLTELYFVSNEISRTTPVTLGNLVNLIALGMEYNLFTGLIPTIFEKFQKIQLLALNGNRLLGEIPTSIGNLTQLFLFDLDENRLEGIIPPSIGNCQNLQYLNLSQNNFHGFIPQQLIGLTSLTTLLNLSHNSFDGKLPSEVGNLKNIKQLDISENNLFGEIPSSIGNRFELGIP